MVNVGYIRVSTAEQNTARQLDGLTLDRVFEDRCSGATTNRPALAEMLRYLRAGDTLHVHGMSRLARNLTDLRSIVADLTGRGVTVRFVREGLEFGPAGSSPMAELLLSVMGAVAQFERDQVRERQREGIAKAKQRGVYRGRKPEIDVGEVRRLRTEGLGATAIASKLGIGRASVYRVLSAQ